VVSKDIVQPPPTAALRTLVRCPQWRWWAAGSVLSRLPGNMVPLALVLAFPDGRGALIASCFIFGAVLAAVWRARTMDRGAMNRRMSKEALLTSAAQVVLAVATVLALPTAGLIIVATAAGATGTALGAAYRAALPKVVPAAVLPAAYTADAVIIEVSFVTSPVLVAGLVALFLPASVFMVGAVLALLSAIAVRRIPAGQPAVPGQDPRSRLTSAFVVFAIAAASGTVLGLLQAGVPAKLATLGHSPTVAGVLFGIMSGTSGVVGVLITTRGGIRGRYGAIGTALFAVAAVALAVLATGQTFAVMVVAIALFGAPLAPLNALAALAINQRVSAHARTQAFAMLNVSTVAGSSLGLAAAAGLLPHGQVAPVFATVAVCALITISMAVTLLVTSLGRRTR